MENAFEGMDTRKIIRKTRHKAELPLKFISIILTCLVFLMVGILAESAKEVPEIKSAIIEVFNETAEEEAPGDFSVAGLVVDMGIGCSIVLVVGLIILLLVMFYRMYARIMSYSVKVTPKNFPEIYEKAKEYTEKLGLKKMPEVYVEQKNGELNAFATYIIGKRYVCLNAEIVDVAYMENKDFDTVFFVMGHEFGHIYYHHVTLWYNLFTFAARLIPIFGPLLSRAQEYSADRAAQALTDNVNADKCMALLSGGRHLYKYIDVQEYVESANRNHNFLERLCRFILNLTASHPIMPFRAKALLDPKRRSGRLI